MTKREDEQTPTGVLYANSKVIVANIRIAIINRDPNLGLYVNMERAICKYSDLHRALHSASACPVAPQ